MKILAYFVQVLNHFSVEYSIAQDFKSVNEACSFVLARISDC